MGDSVITLRPNTGAPVANIWWTNVGAAPDIGTALSDNTDSNYAQILATFAVQYSIIQLSVDNSPLSAMPALSIVKGIQLRMKGRGLATAQIDTTVDNCWVSLNGVTILGGQLGYHTDSSTAMASQTVWNGPRSNNSPTTKVIGTNPQGYGWNIHFHIDGPPGNQITTDTHQVTAVYFDVFYNEAAVVSAIQPSTAVATVTPTVTWTYADPEGDAQENYRILIYRDTDAGGIQADMDASVTNNAAGNVYYTSNTVSALAVYDSGWVRSSVPNQQIPLGSLHGSIDYRVYVAVTDAGNFNRMSAITAAGPYSVFTPTLDPMLSPVLEIRPYTANSLYASTNAVDYNTLNGQISPIALAQRLNYLPVNDASFEAGVSGSTGSWHNNMDGVGGAGHATLTSGTSLPMMGIGHAILTMDGTGSVGTNGDLHTNLVTINQPPDPLNTPLLVMGVISVAAHNAAAEGVAVQVGLKVQDPSSNTVFIYSPTNHTCYSGADGGATDHYKKLWVLAQVPAGFNKIGLVLDFPNGAPANAVFYVDCAAITPSTLNLLEISGFESEAPLMWKSVLSGPNTAARVLDDALGDGTRSAQFVSTAGNANAYIYTADVGLRQTYIAGEGGVKFLASMYAKSISGNVATGPAVGLTTATSGGPFTNPAYTTSWARYTELCDMGSFSPASKDYFFITGFNSSLTQTGNVDDVMLEPLVQFANGDMEAGSNGVSPLGGIPLNGTSGNTGWVSDSTTLQPIYTNAQAHGGTLSLGFISAGSFGTIQASQVFSIGGLSTIDIALFYRPQSVNGTYTIRFDQFNSGGTRITSTTLVSTTSSVASWVGSTTNAIPIDARASFGRIVSNLVCAGAASVYLDDVTITTHGMSAASPYLDGGWSGGGFLQHSGASLGLQRSLDLVNWTYVRGPASSSSRVAGAASTVGPDNAVVFDDFEWPISPTDASANTRFWYRAIGSAYSSVANDFQSAYSHSQMSSGTPLILTNWRLNDLTNPFLSYTLNVKTVKITTDESAQTYAPIGRNRKVVVGDVLYGEHISLELFAFTNADFENLKAVVDQQNTLMLRSPDGYSWFVRAVKRSHDREWKGNYTTKALRTYTVEFEEVDVPS